MKIQVFYKIDKIANDRWRVSTNVGNTEVVSTISSDDAVKVFRKVISPTVVMPFSFFFVSEYDLNDSSSVRFTIVDSIDDLSMIPAWNENRDIYDEIMVILGREDYQTKYKVLVGGADKSETKRMIKIVEFLDMVPIVRQDYRERMVSLITDINCVFYSHGKNESMSSYQGTEVRVCSLLDIPYYNMDEIMEMVTKKAIGEEIKINVSRNLNGVFHIDNVTVTGNERQWTNPYYAGDVLFSGKLPDTNQ